MTFNLCHGCLLIVAVLLVLSFKTSCAEESENSNTNDKKNDMQMLLPLLFMLAGCTSVHSPAIWLMGTLCLFVVAFLGKDSFKMKAA